MIDEAQQARKRTVLAVIDPFLDAADPDLAVHLVGLRPSIDAARGPTAEPYLGRGLADLHQAVTVAQSIVGRQRLSPTWGAWAAVASAGPPPPPVP